MGTASPAQPPAGGLNVGAILKRMLAHLPVALVVLVLGVSVTMVLSRSRKPTYASETVIYYREGINRQYVGVEDQGGDVLKALPARLKEKLLSRAHLEKITKEFNLYPQIVALEGYIAAVDRFRTKITFKPRSAETFLIAFEGATAEEAQEVTARLADVLIEDMAERKKAQAKTTTEFLETEKKRADDDLQKRETDLARFIAQHPEFATEANAEQAGSGVRAEKARAVADPELLAMERQQQRIRAALDVKVGGGVVAGGGPAAAQGPDPGLVAAKNAADQELANAQKDLDDKQAKLTDQHPDVMMAKNRLAAAQAKARAAAVALKAAIEAPPKAAAPVVVQAEDPYEAKPADERARLERELSKNDRELQMRKRGIKPAAGSAADLANQIIAIETEWKMLNREREKARARQGNIDDRLFKAEANAASELGGYNAQVMVLDPAFLPNMPGNMPKSKFIMIGILVSALAGLVFAAAWGMLLDDRVFVADDLAGFAPVLGVIPRGLAEKKGKRRA